MLIIKILGPEYYILSYNIYYFFIELINIIYNKNNFKKSSLYNLLAEFFAIFWDFNLFRINTIKVLPIGLLFKEKYREKRKK